MSLSTLNKLSKQIDTTSLGNLQIDARTLSFDEFQSRHKDNPTWIKVVEWVVTALYVVQKLPFIGTKLKLIISLFIAFCEGVLLQGKIKSNITNI